MGVRLSTTWPKARPETFPDGVIVTMRPACSVEHLAAQDAVRNKLDTLKEASDMAEMLGLAGIELGVSPMAKIAASPQYALGLSQHLMAVELATMIVTGWENVENAEGNPAPMTRGALGAFFLDQERLRRFQELAYGEGSVSAA